MKTAWEDTSAMCVWPAKGFSENIARITTEQHKVWYSNPHRRKPRDHTEGLTTGRQLHEKISFVITEKQVGNTRETDAVVYECQHSIRRRGKVIGKFSSAWVL